MYTFCILSYSVISVDISYKNFTSFVCIHISKLQKAQLFHIETDK